MGPKQNWSSRYFFLYYYYIYYQLEQPYYSLNINYNNILLQHHISYYSVIFFICLFVFPEFTLFSRCIVYQFGLCYIKPSAATSSKCISLFDISILKLVLAWQNVKLYFIKLRIIMIFNCLDSNLSKRSQTSCYLKHSTQKQKAGMLGTH